jgi:hypothetical protein
MKTSHLISIINFLHHELSVKNGLTVHMLCALGVLSIIQSVENNSKYLK